MTKHLQALPHDGSFYYTASAAAGGASGPAALYRYEPGLYKIGADGGEARLASDHIDAALPTGAGTVYTLAYEQGI